MKKNKIFMIFLFILIVIILGGYCTIKYLKDKETQSEIQEYTPQEEINDEQFRQTIVSLYFLNEETNELMPEARLIDVAQLVSKPYETLVQLLIDGPKNEKLAKLIPDGVKICGIELQGECVVVNLSEEFTSIIKDTNLKDKTVQSIVNTLTELTEVNSVKFLINGQENENFKDIFTRKN